MIRTTSLLISLMVIGACDRDETVRQYGAADKTWVLTELNGSPFSAETALSFQPQNRISGTGPCNVFTGRMATPYPWFGIENLAATKRICPDLAEETAFFNALSQATLSEVLGDTMILSNPDGLTMVFKSGG